MPGPQGAATTESQVDHERGRARLDDAAAERLGQRALVAVLGLNGLVVVVYSLLVVTFGWEVFVGESLNAFYIDELGQGDAIYVPWTDDRLIFPIYPPGFYWASTPLGLLAGYEFWPGRLIAIGSMGFAAFAAARVALRLGASRLGATASGLGLLTFGFAALLVPAARPDGLALAFAAGALWAASAWEDARDRRSLALAAAACVAMVITKQNFAPIVLAIALAVWLRDRRAATRFVLGVGVATIALIALAELTSGGAFVESMRDFGATGYALGALRGVLNDVLLPLPNPLLVVGAIEAALLLRSWRSAPAVAWAWPASLLVLASAVKLGSSTNYWLMTALVSAILLGPALRRLGEASRPAAAAVATALALLFLPSAVDFAGNLPDANDQFVEARDANEQVVRQIRSAEGELLADRQDLAVRSGHEPSFDAAPFSLLDRGGDWDPGPVAERIRSGSYAVIQSSFDLDLDPIPLYENFPIWPPELVLAARDAYCPLWSSAAARVWLYRPCQES